MEQSRPITSHLTWRSDAPSVRAALAIGLLLLVSGCVGGVGTSGPTRSGGSTALPAPDNTTLEGVLLGSPHLKVVAAATLQWNVENGSIDSPKVAATLVKFTDAFKASFVGISGDVKLVAAIPLDGFTIDAGCSAQPTSVKSYFQPRDSVQKGGQTMTATYGPGWYHFVVVSTGDGSFGISFDTKKEGKPRTLPARDPYVSAGYAVATGSREPTYTVDAANKPWLAWATTTLPNSNTQPDGGREITANVGGCQTGTSTTANGRTASAAAAGNAASPVVKGSYKPTVATLAPTSVTLGTGWVTVTAPEVKTAP